MPGLGERVAQDVETVLAGGPGGSGVDAARGRRFPIFMALREVADVIAFDQRGTGWSNHIPPCEQTLEARLEGPVTQEEVVSSFRHAAAECAKFWKASGIDLASYNTWESAADVDELRVRLGAEKISL